MLKKLMDGVGSGAGRVKELASKAADGGLAGWTTVKDFTLGAASAGSDRVETFLDTHWSTIEKVIVDGLLTIAVDRLSDDQVVRGVMEKVYETFPVGVRLVMPRDRYLEFALARRDPLLLRLDEYRAQRASGGEKMESLTDQREPNQEQAN